MSNKLKYILAIMVFIILWVMVHRFSTQMSPPTIVELISVLFCVLLINIFTIYYAFIHKMKRGEKRQTLNWRQLFVIASVTLFIAYKVYFALVDIQHGLKDKSGIIQHNTVWIIGTLVIGGIWAFLVRDKCPPNQKNDQNQ